MTTKLLARSWVISVALLFALVTPGLAQVDATDDRYVGRYRFDGSAADGRRRVTEALSGVLGRLNPVLRMAANARLEQSEPVPRRIDLTVRGDRIGVRYVGRDAARTFTSRAGRPRTVRGQGDAWEARMTQLFRAGRLEQIFERDQGRWYNVFELDESGRRLTLRVVISANALDEPIQIQLSYVRMDSDAPPP